MEAVNRRSEALKPPSQSFLGFSSTPRRSHLDSASYRSLVRILSHCLDHSLPLQPCPKDSISPLDIPHSFEDSTVVQGRLEAESNNVATLTERNEDGDRHANGGGQEEIVAAGAELVSVDLSDFDPSDENETVAHVNSDVLSKFMFGCGGLVGVPKEEIRSSGELNKGNGHTGHEPSVHSELEVLKSRIYGSDDGASHLCDLSGSVKGQLVTGEHKNFEESLPSCLKEFTNERIRVVVLDDLVRRELVEDAVEHNLVEIQDINSKIAVENEEPLKQKAFVHSTNSIDDLGLRKFEDNQRNSVDHQNDDRDVEEGEISDDVQELDELEDIINEEKVPQDKNIDGTSVDHFTDAISTINVQHKEEDRKHGIGDNLSAIYRQGASIDYESKCFDTFDKGSNGIPIEGKQKVVEAKEKRKHGTLTAERKAKRKCAKKRKRAQKNREQGVKKLKLLPVAKAKEVKYCNFYLMGKCQQGDLCKFSHDTTPVTKSMPCRHFACNSCLKGDDCPFDHELSKYPCHNFVSTGTCNRGDRCKFSHKMPSSDASSASTIGKLDSGMMVEKLKLRKQSDKVNCSSSGKPLMKLKPLKAAAQMPKGVRFLSFGTPPLDSLNKARESCNQQVLGDNCTSNLSSNSLSPLSSVQASGLAVNGSAATSSGGKVNSEVLEATRILEEFLFCGTI